MLSYQWHTQQGIPVVFLHGLLGSQQDWLQVLHLLQNSKKIRPLTVDLPFHGLSQNISCTNFVDIRSQLQYLFTSVIGAQPFYLVGYSLGGRIALDYTLNTDTPHLSGTILEGTNIGLNNESERQSRWQNDTKWANRFRYESIEKVLDEWYQQPVFAALTPAQRAKYIAERRYNEGEYIAEMLEATSLAKQSNYAEQLKQTQKNIVFLIGENDLKFRQLAEQYQLPAQLIQNAGHNAHNENAKDFTEKLMKLIN